MTRWQFWILNGTSLLLVTMIAFELVSSQQLTTASALRQQAQLPVLQAERMQPVTRFLIQRMVAASASDPALLTVLARHGFKVAPIATAPAKPPVTSDPASGPSSSTGSTTAAFTP